MSRTLLLLAATIAFPPKSRAVAQGMPLEQTVDTSIRPGNDFFAYANGAWLKSTAIPTGKERWGVREEIGAVTRRRVAALYEAAANAPIGSDARKVGDFRAAYLNDSIIETRGLAPLMPLLDSIGRLQDRTALTRFLGRGMVADVDPLNWGVFRSSHILGLSVEMGINGERTYVAFLVQGGLGLSDREDYLGIDSSRVAMRARYLAYLEQLLTLAGESDAAVRARGVLALETAIATSQATQAASAQDHNADSLWTRADFARRAPGMDWSVFFAAAGLGRQQQFVPWQPSAVVGVAALVAAQPLVVWKDYLRVHALDQYADLLPHRFADAAAACAAAGTGPAPARAERAAAATQLALGDALGRMYAERYFPAAQKARVQGIVANVTAAFAHHLEQATWMDPATKRAALAKVRGLYVGIGYPDRWQDYSDLRVDPTDALGNVRRAEARMYRRTLARLGRPVDRSEWWMLPQVVGGILIFQQNAYDFSAALLQAPKFDSTASDAAAYGAIGATIGHDVSHYVDLLGAEFDLDGRERRWWTAEDLAGFEALTHPLVDQFSAYRPFPDVAVDGQHSRGENVADLAGLTSAFDAYRASLGGRVIDREYVRRQDREFFVAFAQTLRSRLSDAELRRQAVADHAPDQYRVDTVRNLDPWYEAFDVQPGQALYLEPAARVRIW